MKDHWYQEVVSHSTLSSLIISWKYMWIFFLLCNIHVNFYPIVLNDHIPHSASPSLWIKLRFREHTCVYRAWEFFPIARRGAWSPRWSQPAPYGTRLPSCGPSRAHPPLTRTSPHFCPSLPSQPPTTSPEQRDRCLYQSLSNQETEFSSGRSVEGTECGKWSQRLWNGCMDKQDTARQPRD